jgi:amino acid adenylation domain-containing protein
VAEIRARLGVELSIRDVFERPRVAELARLIDNGRVSQRPAVTAVARDSDYLPTSFAQQRLWFIDRLGGGSTHYNMPGALRVSGAFDVDIAEQAMARIVARHEPLRTVFVQRDEAVLQQVRSGLAFRLDRHDLRGVEPAVQQERLGTLVAAEARTPFDLAQDLMLRAGHVQLNDGEGVLLFNLHHIASDGWSMGVLQDEFLRLYDAFAAGQEDPLPPLTLHYADYALWQRRWLEGAVMEAQLAYWQQQLADLPAVHGLPLDRPRPPMQRFVGARRHFALPLDVMARLRRVALDNGSSVYMVLHAALAALLSRHGNSDDIVIGMPVANRPQKELQALVGFFVNMLVLRVDCAKATTFRDLLAQVRQVNLDAQTHQDVPFELLVERLNPARSTQHSPLFQIVLNMNVAQEPAAPAASATTWSPLHSNAVTPKFELSWHANETPEGLSISLEYNSDLFDEASVDRLGEHFSRLLHGIAADADMPLGQLPLLSGAEQEYLLRTVNTTAQDYPDAVTLDRWFEAQVALHEQRPALVFDTQILSYGDVNRRANQLANVLRANGAGPDQLVGICLPRSPLLLISVLAVLKSGAAYLPLDPDYPAQRLAYLIHDSGTRLALAQSDTAPLLPDTSLLLLDSPALARQMDEADDIDADDRFHRSAGDLAYAIYTSGSTGQPKGVLIEHASVCNLAFDLRSRLGVDASARVLQFASLNFDAAVLEWTLALLSGASLYLCTDEQRAVPARLQELLQRQAITHALLPPALLQHLDSTADYALHCLLVGGEACDADLAQRWAGKCRFINAYGPTEVTVCATLAPIAPGEDVSIGRPLANTRLYVLGRRRELLPFGAVGELYIGGAGVGRGYLGRPDLTAQRFVADEYSGAANARLYASGDLVRYLPDGRLAFIGRADGQVKMRGFRIELGEIEHVLGAIAEVANAAVIVREDEPGQRRLVAYVTHRSVSEPDRQWTAALRAALAAQLPEHMLPAAIVALAAMPLTVSGKIDRRALPLPEGFIEHVAPATASEQALVTIWSEVLRREPEQVSTTANFFELGGHSLLAAQLVPRLRKELGKSLQLRHLFQLQTIRALAEQLDLQLPDGDTHENGLDPCLVLLADGDATQPALFLVHAVGGEVYGYAQFAAALGHAGPVYGLRATEGFDTIEQAAQGYVAAVRQTAFADRCRLGGWSLGGAVAFEMARQLRQAGADVLSLQLFDSLHPSLFPDTPQDRNERVLLQTLAAELDIRYDAAGAPPLQEIALMQTADLMEIFLTMGRMQHRLPDDFDAAALRLRLDQLQRRSAALRRYRPEFYDGPVQLLRAADNSLQPYALGWEQVAATVEVSEHAGDHFSMWRGDNGRELAAAVGGRLRGSPAIARDD